jgi:hypothetical protein
MNLTLLAASIKSSALSSLSSSNESLLSIGGGGYKGGGRVAWPSSALLIVAKLLATVEVVAARVYVEKMMRLPSVCPSLYTPEAAEGRGTCGIAINFVGRGGRQPLGKQGIAINMAQTTEATHRRQYWRAREDA